MALQIQLTGSVGLSKFNCRVGPLLVSGLGGLVGRDLELTYFRMSKSVPQGTS